MPQFKGFTELTPEQQAALTREMGTQVREENEQTIEWVEELCELTRRLAEGESVSKSDLNMYWVRLYEFITRIGPRFMSKTSAESPSEVLRKLIEISAMLERLYALVRSTLTEDEVIYVEVRRHRSAHAYQHKLYASPKQKGDAWTVKDTTTIAALDDRLMSLVDIRMAIERVESCLGTSPVDVATALSTRTRESLMAFRAALVRKYDVS